MAGGIKETNRCGGDSGACHGLVYVMTTILRKFRETRLYLVAPISTNMVFSYVAEHLLGLPKSY